MVTFPFLILILDFLLGLFVPHLNKSMMIRLGYFAILAGYLILRRSVLGDWIGGYGSSIHIRLDFSMLERNFIFFTARTFLPATDYPIHAWILRLGRLGLFIGLAALIMSAGILWKAWWEGRLADRLARTRVPFLLLALFLMYVVALAPVLNLNIHLGGSLGERLIYFPGVFIILAGVYGVFALLRRPRPAVLILGTVSVFYAVTLDHANLNWMNAGKLTGQIVRDLDRLGPARRLYILNLPDTIGGAYVFRNGIKSAYNLFGDPARLEEIRVVSFQSLARPEDSVEVRRLSPGVIEVKAGNPGTYFLNRRIPPSDLAYFQILEREQSRFTVRFPNLSPEDRVAYFSMGSLHMLP